MIAIRGISKSFGEQDLFEDAFLQINQDDRYALVGPNGSGKSTLFRMMLGEIEPDRGEMQSRKGIRAGYMPQETAPVSEKTVVEESLAGCRDADARLTAKAKEILMGLGFRVSDFGRKVNSLSGGWAMRVVLARLLVGEPDILLLDEPTNHLDLDSLLWLQEYLLSYRGAIFMISHDRAFINTICRAVVSVQDRKLRVYHGNYEHYLVERGAERERLEAAYKQQGREIAAMEDFIARNRARYSTAKRVQSTIKKLEKIRRIEMPPESKTVRIDFPQPERTGVRVLSLRNVSKSYGDTRVYERLDFELERGQMMAFVGHNGAGKSTLLKLLAGVLSPDSGERHLGLGVKTGYYSQHRAEMLDPEKTVLKEAMSVRRLNPELMVRTVLGTFLFPGDAVFKKVENLSGGEKSRLALVKLLLDPPNVLLLDEPTTHLDVPSIEALVGALKKFEGTACFISHDLYFMNQLANHIVHVDEGKITGYPGNYEYFQRRQEQKAAEAPRAAGDRPDLRIRDASGKRDSRVEVRQKRAARRRAEKEMEQLMAGIDSARKRMETLTKQFEDPAICGDFKKVGKIGDEIKDLKTEIAFKEMEISTLEESLNNLPPGN